MTRTIVLREVFPSRDEAEAARDRLADHGFSLSSISLTGTGGPCELIVRAHPEDRYRAEQAIRDSWLTHQTHRYARQVYEHAPSREQSVLLFGAIALAGAALVYAFSRSQQERRYRPRVTRLRNRKSRRYNEWGMATPQGHVAGGYGTERRRTEVTSDDDRLRTASGAVPPSTSAGGA
jgi:hypothetical protein